MLLLKCEPPLNLDPPLDVAPAPYDGSAMPGLPSTPLS